MLSKEAAAADRDAAGMLPYLKHLHHTDEGQEKPNVLLLLVDDMGFNDIGYHSTDLPFATPALDALAEDGVKLSRYYTPSTCTPARATLLTGRYASSCGMGVEGSSTFATTSSYGLPLRYRTVADAFKDAGYATHMAGKWNVGHAYEAYWPHRRGFDTFLGYMGDEETYYVHEAFGVGGVNYTFCDFADANASTASGGGIHVGDCHVGQYSTDLYADRLERAVLEHDAVNGSPLFLYWASQAVHSPLEKPPMGNTSFTAAQERMFAAIRETQTKAQFAEDRVTFAMMLLRLDQRVRQLLDVMYARGALANSIVVVTSDNGGCSQDGGNNWPLRGTKFSSFEGGVRVPAFVWSSRIGRAYRGQGYGGVFHACDWLPTLLSAAAAQPPEGALKGIDGVDQWAKLATAGKGGTGRGVPTLLHMDAWRKYTFNSTGDDDATAHDSPIFWELSSTLTNVTLQHSLAAIIDDAGYKVIYNMPPQPAIPPSGNYSARYCHCGAGGSPQLGARYLFDVVHDPTESVNLWDSSSHAEIRRLLEAELERHHRVAVGIGSAWRPPQTDQAQSVWAEFDNFIGPWLGNSTYRSNAALQLAGVLDD